MSYVKCDGSKSRDVITNHESLPSLKAQRQTSGSKQKAKRIKASVELSVEDLVNRKKL